MDPALTAALDQHDAAMLHYARLTVRYRKRLERGGFTKDYAQAMAQEFHTRLIRHIGKT